MAENYANMLKTITMGLLFMPLVPINALFTVVALLLQYCSAKYACLRNYRQPPPFSGYYHCTITAPSLTLNHINMEIVNGRKYALKL